jgi:hypothetical protein
MAQKRGLLFLLALYVFFPLLLSALLILGWMLSLESATVVLQSSTSPDGVYRGEVVRRDPGVSDNYEYMVRISPAKLTPLARKLLALPFSPRYVALELYREPDKLSVQWTGNRELTVRCEGCAGATKGEPEWRNVRLKYELK